MKPFYFLSVVFLLVGVFSVAAQDLIVLKDGSMIEAKVEEISPTEIKYRRFDHLDGPMIVIPAANVLSIRYENGTNEIINAGAVPAQDVQAVPQDTAMDPDKFHFGINANAGGALGYITGTTGAGINIELGKGRFNSEINLMIPKGGFGALVTFNGFWPNRIGGFYLGGGVGFSMYEYFGYIHHWDWRYRRDNWDGQYYYYDDNGNRHDTNEEWGWTRCTSLTAGLNIGHKFVTKSGLYFRTGAFAGFDFGWLWNDVFTFPVFLKPDLSVGWTMK